MTHSYYATFRSVFEDRQAYQVYSFQLLFLVLTLSMLMPTTIVAAKTLDNINCDEHIAHLDCDGDGTINGEDIAPLDPCIGGKKPLDKNDCDEDGVTVGEGDPDDYDFCIPNLQPACENYQAIEEEIEFEEDPIVVETNGVVAIVTNPCPTEVENYGDCDGDGTPNNEDEDPFNPCIGGTKILATNDCDGDGVTVGQGDTDDYDFCVPVAQSGCETSSPLEGEEEEEFDLEVTDNNGIVAVVDTPSGCSDAIDPLDCDGDGTPNNEDEEPLDPCVGGIKALDTNDCDGDGVTVGQGDTDDYDFCVPVAQPGCETSSPIEGEEEEEFDLEVTDNNGIVAVVDTPSGCSDAIDPSDCDGDGTPNNEDEEPLDPCMGGTKALDTNDCDGDGVTVGQGDTDDYDFCVPVAQPGCETSSPIEGEEEEEFDLEVTDNNGIAATVDTPSECSSATDPSDCDGDGTPNNEDEEPFDPCIGGTKALDTNDCDGDGMTVGQGDTDDYDFCVPVESPECGTESSTSDIDSQTVLIAPCDNIEACYSTVAIKALLQGSYDEDNPAIMYDKLRALNYLPLKEPYKDLKIYDGDPIPFKIVGEGNESVKQEVLNVTGEDAVVDWVFVQLHDENDPKKVVATRSALIQRDGDVVDTDGVSPVKISIAPGKYYISIRHRNHLGVMTKTALILSKNINSIIDFTNINTSTYELSDSRKKSNHAQRRIDDLYYLWGGNSNGDWATIYQGPGLDQTKVFYDIFVDDKNKGPDGFPNYNYIKRGYSISDSNMDGEIRYQGPDNDVDDLQFFNIILHPDNPGFFNNKIIYEQIPRSSDQ